VLQIKGIRVSTGITEPLTFGFWLCCQWVISA